MHDYLRDLNLHVLNGSVLFNGGMLLFVDRTGKYLVVEAGSMTMGNASKFALANFSIANTRDLSAIKTQRYRKGVAFLNNKPLAAELSYCTALSDTMSVDRPKAGDGTLYTSIYDLQQGLFHLYFFHDYSRRVTFNLQQELAKGGHSYEFAGLFPGNQKFMKFIQYKTPQNNRIIFIFMVTGGLIFLFTFFYFLFANFKKGASSDRWILACFVVLSLAFAIYTYVLLNNEAIYYFPAPYQDDHSTLAAITAYLPSILLLIFPPLTLAVYRIIKLKKWQAFARYLLAANHFVYLALLAFFWYWELFDIFS